VIELDEALEGREKNYFSFYFFSVQHLRLAKEETESLLNVLTFNI
jgi:hypothetical protein